MQGPPKKLVSTPPDFSLEMRAAEFGAFGAALNSRAVCTHCHKTGHTEDNCYARPAAPQVYLRISSSNSNNSSKVRLQLQSAPALALSTADMAELLKLRTADTSRRAKDRRKCQRRNERIRGRYTERDGGRGRVDAGAGAAALPVAARWSSTGRAGGRRRQGLGPWGVVAVTSVGLSH